MKRLALAAAVALAAALVVPATSFAKGATEATITGPGLGKGIELSAYKMRSGVILEQLAAAAGFFPAVFETSPNPMRDAAPQGSLGPRYRITYAMPGPGGVVSRLQQDLYPYATPAPVSYTKPGQGYWGGQRTVGGWYTAEPILKADLVSLGVPETPPNGDGFDPAWWLVLGALSVTAALAVGALTAARVRRRPRPATA